MQDMHDQYVPLPMLVMERYLWEALSVDMTAVIALDGFFEELNPAWEKTVGYSEEELKNAYLIEYLHFDDRESTLGEMQKLVTADLETTSIDFQFMGKDQAYRHILANIGFNPEVNSFYMVARDITERDSACMISAFQDVLTGLPNRYLLYQRLGERLAKVNEEREVAVMFVDLDKFKPVNDTYGHKAGDLLLQGVASRLNEVLDGEGTGVTESAEGESVQEMADEPPAEASSDRGDGGDRGDRGFAARLGGDEFVLVVEGRGEESFGKLAREVIDRLEDDFNILGETVNISASIGIAIYPQHGRTVEDLLDVADEAMYQVKRTGRRNFVIYQPNA